MKQKRWTAPTHPAHLVLGLALWFGWFNLVYGGLSIACRFGAAAPAPLLIALASLLGAGALLALAVYCWRGRGRSGEARRFIASVAAGLYIGAAGATLAVGAPALWLPPCL